MTHPRKTLGLLVARTSAVLLALSALAWFVFRAQRDAAPQSPGAARSVVMPVEGPAAAPSPIVVPVATRPNYYQFSSKFATVSPLAPVPAAPAAPESRIRYQPSSKAGPVSPPLQLGER